MSFTLRSHSFDERIAAGCLVGISSDLIALLWSNRSSLRYGRPGRLFPDVPSLAEALISKGLNLPEQVVAGAHALAVSLDVDDLFFGSTVIPVEFNTPSGSTWSLQLSVASYLDTAMRTGLYLPGRTLLQKKGANPSHWEATATAWTRGAKEMDWVESGCQVRFADEVRKPGRDAVTWSRSAQVLLPLAAVVQVVDRSLTPLFINVATELH